MGAARIRRKGLVREDEALININNRAVLTKERTPSIHSPSETNDYDGTVTSAHDRHT